MESLRDLVARAVSDTGFRSELLADPEKTVQEAGLTLTEREMDGLKLLSESDFECLTLEDLDERLSKSADGMEPLIVGTFVF